MLNISKSEFRTLMGQKVRKQRMEHGLSVDELAALLGLSAGFIGLIERGERGLTVYNLLKLSHILNVSVEAFMSEISSASNPYPENYESVCHKKLSIITKDFSRRKLEFLIAAAAALEDI